MLSRALTFGQAIASARKVKGIEQRALAAAVLKDDGGAISPQYLNDIEHDRRTPTADGMIRQLARAVGLDPDYLFVLAGKIPDDVRRKARDPEKVAAAFREFRRSLG